MVYPSWPRFDTWMVIGGERGKGRPCWIVIGGERGKVGHVGFGRGVTSFFWGYRHDTSQIQTMGEESVTSRVLKKKVNYLFIF